MPRGSAGVSFGSSAIRGPMLAKENEAKNEEAPPRRESLSEAKPSGGIVEERPSIGTYHAKAVPAFADRLSHTACPTVVLSMGAMRLRGTKNLAAQLLSDKRRNADAKARRFYARTAASHSASSASRFPGPPAKSAVRVAAATGPRGKTGSGSPALHLVRLPPRFQRAFSRTSCGIGTRISETRSIRS